MNTDWDKKENRPQLDGHDLIMILLPGFSGMIMGFILESFPIILAGLGGSAIVNIIKILKTKK